MTKVRKSFLVLPLLFTVFVTAVMFSACGKTAELTLSENLADKASIVVNNIVQNVYNAPALKDDVDANDEQKYEYSFSEVKQLIPEAEFYVEVGTFKNIDELKTLTIGDYTFKADDKISVSVGNSNFIKDKAFVVDQNKLLVCANIVVFESNSEKIKLNDAEFNFDIRQKIGTIEVESIVFRNGKNTIQKDANASNKYNLSIVNGTDSLLIDYANKEADDTVFTRKVVDGVLTGYGVTKLDVVNAESYFMFYPVGWANTQTAYDEARQAKNGKTLAYEFYVAGKGMAKLNFAYDIAEYSPENA